MCKKLPYCNPRIDDCLKNYIKGINILGFRTVASCCGHGKYPRTILYYNEKYGTINDWDTGLYIKFYEKKKKRGQRYYKKDKDGYYYVPELITYYFLHNKRKTDIFNNS